jgi:hypothetical protein
VSAGSSLLSQKTFQGLKRVPNGTLKQLLKSNLDGWTMWTMIFTKLFSDINDSMMLVSRGLATGSIRI